MEFNFEINTKAFNMLDTELIEQFPEYKKEILLLLKQDDNFREIAEDFIFCKQELKQISLTTKKNLISQYAETLEDLKEEIISRIQNLKN